MQMPRQVKVFFLILLFNSGIDTKLLGIVTWLAIIKRGGRKLKPLSYAQKRFYLNRVSEVLALIYLMPRYMWPLIKG